MGSENAPTSFIRLVSMVHSPHQSRLYRSHWWTATSGFTNPLVRCCIPMIIPLPPRCFRRFLTTSSGIPLARTRAGEYRVGEFRAVPQKDQRNKIVSVLGVSRNITDALKQNNGSRRAGTYSPASPIPSRMSCISMICPVVKLSISTVV